MPTILTVLQFKLYFYSREGDKMHVHALHKGLGIEVVVWLDENCSLKRSSGNSRIDGAARSIVQKNKQTCIDKWNEHFGVNNG